MSPHPGEEGNPSPPAPLSGPEFSRCGPAGGDGARSWAGGWWILWFHGSDRPWWTLPFPPHPPSRPAGSTALPCSAQTFGREMAGSCPSFSIGPTNESGLSPSFFLPPALGLCGLDRSRSGEPGQRPQPKPCSVTSWGRRQQKSPCPQRGKLR